MIIDLQRIVDVRCSQKSLADGHRSFSERQGAPVFALRFLNQPFKLGFTFEYFWVRQIDCSTRLDNQTQQHGREQDNRAHHARIFGCHIENFQRKILDDPNVSGLGPCNEPPRRQVSPRFPREPIYHGNQFAGETLPA